MRPTIRAGILLVIALMFITFLGPSGGAQQVQAQIPVEISNVEVPDQVPQAHHGEVNATVYNSINQTFDDGFAQFIDDTGEITCTMVNFSIDFEEEVNITVQYQVAENATTGYHNATFEINVGGYSFLLEQYLLEVIPAATIISLTTGMVFSQNQPGIVIATIENRVGSIRNVTLEFFGASFANATTEVELAPGINTLAITLQHEAVHIYDFGLSPVNMSISYKGVVIGSIVAVIPVDMLLLNKVFAIILPVAIFECLVVFYAFRKRQRLRTTTG
ncbi:MAG: hypothetical protein ACFFCO_07940 [Promethearchaeota archaeon]